MPITPGRGIVAALIAAAPLLAQTVPVKEHTLSNGMRLLMVERHDQPTIAAGWIVRAGSANEKPGMTGMAHLFEHMMFKGTKTLGTKDIKRDLELNDLQDKLRAEIRKEEDGLRRKQTLGEIADMNDPKLRSERHQKLLTEFAKLVKEQQDLLVKGEFDTVFTKAGASATNAFTNTDVTYYHVTMPSNKLELWTWMESGRLLEPVFREFYAERDVVTEERRMRTDSTPTGKFEEALQAMIWTAHPYHWPVVGWASDVVSITREQANEFFATYYAPNNLTAVLVGDFKSADAIQMCEKYFGRIPANPKGVPEVITLEPKQLAEKRMNAEAETTPQVQVWYKSVPTGHKDEPALQILSYVLNGNSGRLQKNLVLGQKVATAAGAFPYSRRYAGNLVLYGVAAGEQKPEEVEQALYREIEKIQKEGVPALELRKAQNQAQADSFRKVENNEALATQLAVADASGNLKTFLDLPKLLETVTAADVQRVATTYLVKENRNVAVYTRKVETGPVDPELAKVPEKFRPTAKAAVAQFEKETDAAKLKQQLGEMEGQAAQVPEPVKPLFEFLLKKLRERVAKLEAK
ncbi:MAG: pitrilysin family protein [Holophaga sp.]